MSSHILFFAEIVGFINIWIWFRNQTRSEPRLTVLTNKILKYSSGSSHISNDDLIFYLILLILIYH
ncbi:hypothetical protein AYB34_14085 [Leptospira sp. ZV016]|nr:hypothetical protein AYB32_14025 [Leptospira kirschneri]KXZ32127.1 hypothetical protein AYB34_14085 [Leptospira sp. ZV016]